MHMALVAADDFVFASGQLQEIICCAHLTIFSQGNKRQQLGPLTLNNKQQQMYGRNAKSPCSAW